MTNVPSLDRNGAIVLIGTYAILILASMAVAVIVSAVFRMWLP